MKTGILTYLGSHNYGAFLQAYALREAVLECTGNAVELIDYVSVKEIETYNFYKLLYQHPRYYMRNLSEMSYYKTKFKTLKKSVLKYHTLSDSKLISDDINEISNFISDKYDLLIAGSDEIWKIDGMRSFPNAYWLPDIKGTKFSYAASSRNRVENISDDNRLLIEHYLKDFTYIGTRDRATYDMTSELSGDPTKCHLNCDPTFLYSFPINREHGEEIIHKKFRAGTSKKRIGLIVSDSKYGYEITQMLNADYEVVSLSSYVKNARNYAKLSPFDWIDVISACDMIITSRFHGAVFSIKTGKPFLAVELVEPDIQTGKLYDLLERNALMQHYISYDRCYNESGHKYITEFVDNYSNMNTDYSDVIRTEINLADSFFDQLKGFCS